MTNAIPFFPMRVCVHSENVAFLNIVFTYGGNFPSRQFLLHFPWIYIVFSNYVARAIEGKRMTYHFGLRSFPLSWVYTRDTFFICLNASILAGDVTRNIIFFFFHFLFFFFVHSELKIGRYDY